MVKLTETDGKEEYRAWLTQDELESLYAEVADNMEREIALRLMGEGGLRSAEVVDVTYEDVRPMEAEGNRYKLVVRHGKGDKRRETVISSTLHDKIQAYSQAYQTGSEPIIDRTTRTLQNWVKSATDAQQGREWEHVSCHDFRRSWVMGLLESGTSVPIIMALGGWEDYTTFRDHYLDTPSDQSIVEQTEGFFSS